MYVAISTLRKLGLRAVLQSDDRGYRLDPGIELVLDDDDPESAVDP